MIIKELQLINFRNYINQKIEFCDGVNVIYGNNAQGKTNILEAINIFSTSKSHRGVKDRELINFNADHARLSIFFDGYGRENLAEIELFSQKRKAIRLNGVNLNRVSRLIGSFNTVLFCPEDLYLIKGGPVERRRFLDSAISPLKPNYFTSVIQYNKILDHKNKLLKEPPTNKSVRETIDIWNERLCQTAARITLYRNAFVNKLNDLSSQLYLDITQKSERLNLMYNPSIKCEELNNEFAIYNEFKKTIEKNFEREFTAGMSLFGPHRDDLIFMINEVDVKSYASQGQQRTVVLAMKMAQIELIKQATKEYPILLLDDILSELDKSRQSFLLEKIESHQVLITCTDAYAIKQTQNKNFYNIKSGIVYKD